LERNFPRGVNSDYRGVATDATPASMKDIGINEHQSSQSRLINREPELEERRLSSFSPILTSILIALI